jgi:hypothetical protein
MLLRAYRHLLRQEDLEDCYSQATLELLAHARRGGRFVGARHVSNTLELRFESRIRDLRRALGGRSPIQAALGTALPLGAAEEPEVAIIDRRADVEQLVLLRNDLRRVQESARELSDDQRLVLASQLVGIRCGQFCTPSLAFDWTRATTAPTTARTVAKMVPAGVSRQASRAGHTGRFATRRGCRANRSVDFVRWR